MNARVIGPAVRQVTVYSDGEQWFPLTEWMDLGAADTVNALLELQVPSADFRVKVGLQTADEVPSEPNTPVALATSPTLSSQGRDNANNMTLSGTSLDAAWIRFGVFAWSTTPGSVASGTVQLRVGLRQT